MTLTDDLFSANQGLEPLPLPDAEVYYMRQFLAAETACTVLRQLIAEVPWRAENIVVWGKSVPQPWLIAWCGDFGQTHTYSGLHLSAIPWTPTLLDLKSRVAAADGTDFNSVLLNYYRDHRDSMGLHSDDEPELGPRPLIASVSVGEARTVIFTHKTDKALKPLRLTLGSGRLLVMKGATQQYWKHGIAQSPRPRGSGVNLTFRRIQS